MIYASLTVALQLSGFHTWISVLLNALLFCMLQQWFDILQSSMRIIHQKKYVVCSSRTTVSCLEQDLYLALLYFNFHSLLSARKLAYHPGYTNKTGLWCIWRCIIKEKEVTQYSFLPSLVTSFSRSRGTEQKKIKCALNYC